MDNPQIFFQQKQCTGAPRRSGWVAAAAIAEEIWDHPAPVWKENLIEMWALDILAEMLKTFASTHCTFVLPVDEEIDIKWLYVLSWTENVLAVAVPSCDANCRIGQRFESAGEGSGFAQGGLLILQKGQDHVAG